jgi:hypothetical protein
MSVFYWRHARLLKLILIHLIGEKEKEDGAET